MKGLSRYLAAAVATFALALAAAHPAWPQSYPSRPIHMIVGYAPGGTGDILGRIIANQLGSELGQTIIVENRAGAGGTIAAHDVVNSMPDGYTILIGQTPEIAVNPTLMKDVGYDPQKDLEPIALAGVVPLALVVPPNSPYSNVAQWAADLRAKKPLTFASAGIGSPSHLGGELLKLKLDENLVHVPYKGAGPALTDVAGGQVDFYFPGYPGAVPLVQSGQVKMLAVSTAKRLRDAPDVPTVAEATGLDNYDFTLWAGFFAPHGVPPDVMAQLNAAINKVIVEPEINARLRQAGAEVTPMSIDQLAAFVRSEIATNQMILKATNLTAQ
jgi:tripartite-type tricarboxylate transporter receptor subunit TctC